MPSRLSSAALIANTCAILHNMCIANNDPEIDVIETSPTDMDEHAISQAGDCFTTAQAIQDQLILSTFN